MYPGTRGILAGMKSIRGLVFVLMAASLLLAACGNEVTEVPFPSPTVLLPTATSTPPPTLTLTTASTITFTPTPLPTPTSSATPIPCDLSVADYCVVDAFFVFQPPIALPGTDVIDHGYPYGSTQGGTQEPHHGVEFHNASGTPVLAAADGIVFYAGDDAARKFSPWFGFYGNIIIIKHSLAGAPFDTLYTLYGHLSKIDVNNGQAVTVGEKIGEVGRTGTAFGNHLHFEVRVNPDDYYSTLNPELWLVPHPGNGTLALSITDKEKLIFPSFNVQYYPDRDQPAVAHYQVDAYVPEAVNPGDPWMEIAALGDQPAGWYRVTFIWAGSLYERWVEIQPGKLTRVQFVVK
jgi:murein DD-endopeptidase MepM/ murein hydrolase activator NlpD